MKNNYQTSTYFKQIMIGHYIKDATIVNAFKETDERGERLCLVYDIPEADMQMLRALLNKELPILSEEDFRVAKKHRHDKLQEYYESKKPGAE